MKAHEFRHEMSSNSSIFGRNNVSVVFEGDQAKTDGETIYLPSLPDDTDLDQHLVMAMRGFVDHEAGHIRHSDMPHILSSYKKWHDNGHDGLVSIQNSLEDIWMEQKVIEEYPGSLKNLRATNELCDDKTIPHLEKNPTAMSEFNTDTVCAAIGSVGRASYMSKDREKFESFVNPVVLEHAKNWTQLARDCKNSEQVTELAKSIYKLIREDPKLQSKPEDFDPESGEGEGEGGSPDETEQQKTSQPQKPGGDKGKAKGKAKEGSGLNEELEKALSAAISKPEGDHVGSYRVLSDRFDKVVRGDKLETGTRENYHEVLSGVKDYVNVMKTRLRKALLSTQRRDWEGGREYGKLDTKRLVSAYGGQRQVFKRRVDRLEENTAVTILVDLSGSMYGEKIELAQQTCVALAECFEGTSIQYQIIGFDSQRVSNSPEATSGTAYHRADANYIYEFKGFNELLRSSKEKLASITKTGGCNNADRDAIMYAIHSMKNREEKRKVLLVLSDGHPANKTINVGYEELTRHANLAVKYGQAKGIECVGVGIMDSTVKTIYPDYVVVKSVDDLASIVFKKFTSILLKGVK